MAIFTKQLDAPSLTLFIQGVLSGAAFSGSFVDYVSHSGWLGPLAVTTTGAQNITGVKTFQISPIVPYSGGTGAAPSQLFVTDLVASLSGTTIGGFVNRGLQNDIISGQKTFSGALGVGDATNTGHAVHLKALLAASGSLTALSVTGSNTITSASITGLGGTLVIYSGNSIFISGAAAGAGGGSNVLVTGSSAISTPNFTGLGGTTVSYDGTYVRISGAAGADVSLSGYVENNFVHRGLINDVISGLKTFSSALGVGNPTNTGHAINLGYLTSVSGVLASAPPTVINTGGNVNNYTFSGITGNFVNMSFFFDEYSLFTGLNNIESFVSRSFFFTGYAIGAINSGTQGFFSGSLYQRNQTNIKTNFIDFSLNSGQFFTGVGGFNQTVTGLNRIGLDIYRIGTGITGLSIGIFGVGY